MKRFSFHLLLFLFLQLGIAVSYLSLEPMRDSSLSRALIDKHEILRRVPPPRILFAGGSSLPFGLDGALIREKLGREPVSLALSVAMGYRFILAEVEDAAQSGDLVVLSLEHLFLPKDHVAEDLSVLLLGEDLRLVRLVPGWFAWKSILDSFLAFLNRIVHANPFLEKNWAQGQSSEKLASELRSSAPFYLARYPLCWRCTGGPVYVRWSFNGFGDHVGHWNQHGGHVDMLAFQYPAPSRAALIQAPILEAANRLVRRLEERGIEVVMVFPPLSDEFASAFEAYLKEAETALRRGAEFPVLGRLEDAVYPRALFYDGPFHLVGAGVKLYTEHLIRELAPFVRRLPEKETHELSTICPPNSATITPRWSDGWIGDSATLCVYAPCTPEDVRIQIACAMPEEIRPVEVTVEREQEIVAKAACTMGSSGALLDVPVSANETGFVHFQLHVDKTFKPSEIEPASPDDRSLGVEVSIQD